MKAICIEEPGKVVVKDIDKPVRKPGEALLKMLYGGICGSDLGSAAAISVRTAAQTPTSRTRVSRGTNSRRKSSKSTRTTKASNLA